MGQTTVVFENNPWTTSNIGRIRLVRITYGELFRDRPRFFPRHRERHVFRLGIAPDFANRLSHCSANLGLAWKRQLFARNYLGTDQNNRGRTTFVFKNFKKNSGLSPNVMFALQERMAST